MEELVLTSEIIFSKNARKYFNFPIENSIRLSFWLLDQEISTFSEIKPLNNIEIEIPNIVELRIVKRDFLLNKIEIGTRFKIGVFPNSIGQGKIISIM